MACLVNAYHEEEVKGHALLCVSIRAWHPLKRRYHCEARRRRDRAYVQNFAQHFRVEYDGGGAVGERYRRMDEVGTPPGNRRRFETLENDTVTCATATPWNSIACPLPVVPSGQIHRRLGSRLIACMGRNTILCFRLKRLAVMGARCESGEIGIRARFRI